MIKGLLSLIVLGSIVVVCWAPYQRLIAREVSIGEDIPGGFLSIFVLLAFSLVLLGIAGIYKCFHTGVKDGLSFAEAVFQVSLACTPIAVNGIALLIWVHFTGDWGSYVLDPFLFFFGAGPAVYDALCENRLSDCLKWLTINYGAAWVWFLLIYGKLAKITKQRLALALVSTLVFVSIAQGVVQAFILGFWDVG